MDQSRSDWPTPRDIFLHTGWRTGGTWIWNRFRALPSALCFYEPLHETLGTAAAARAREPGMPWGTGHPALGKPYFAEYAPLIDSRTGQVPCFPSESEAGPFFADATAPRPALAGYISALVEAARAARAGAVLKFCRSLGRIGWMRAAFPTALHVAVMRNPLSQFASAERQAALHGQPYFLAAPFALLAAQPRHALVAPCLDHLDVAPPPVPPDEPLERTRLRCAAVLEKMPVDARYRVALAFWLATALAIPDDIDLFLSYDMMVLSAAYRRQAEEAIRTATSQHVSFDSPRAAIDWAVPGLTPAAVWRAHHMASRCLLALAGPDWIENPALARAGALLAHADQLGTDRTGLLGIQSAADLEMLDRRRDDAQAVEQLRLRAQRAEQEAAWLRASRSWTLTAPARWAGESLRALVLGRSPRLADWYQVIHKEHIT